jgi:preprotein translocase subunit SecB
MSTATSQEKTPENVCNQPSKQQLLVKKLFVKGLMFEAASLTPESIKASSDVNIDMQAFVNTSESEDEITEVVLALHLTAESQWRFIMAHSIATSRFLYFARI